MRRVLFPILVLLAGGSITLVGTHTAASAPAKQGLAAKKKCRFVIKKIHGKKRKVRVCHTVKPPPPPPPAPPPPPPPLPNVLATIQAGGDGTIEAADGQIWAADVDDDSFERIDAATNSVTATVPARSGRPGYYGIGIGEGAVWLSNYEENTVSRLDPATNAVTAVIAVGEQPEGIAVTPGTVWVANHHSGSVSRIDSTTNRVVATISVGPGGDSGPHDITAAAGSIWTGVPNVGAVVRIDPETNRVLATIPVSGGACRVVAGAADAVWVAGGACGGALTRIDPATDTVVSELKSSELGGEAAGVAIVGDSVWVAVRPGLVVRVDRATGRIAAKFSTTGAPQAIAFADGSLWIRKIGEVLRVRP